MQACHYCGEAARTKDHIVAKAWLPKRVPQALAMVNKVPACERCNNNKKHFRALCTCFICEQAWALMAPLIMPRTKHDIPTIDLATIRGEMTA